MSFVSANSLVCYTSIKLQIALTRSVYNQPIHISIPINDPDYGSVFRSEMIGINVGHEALLIYKSFAINGFYPTAIVHSNILVIGF